MTLPAKEQLKRWLAAPAPAADLRQQIRQSPSTPALLAVAITKAIVAQDGPACKGIAWGMGAAAGQKSG